MQVRGVLFNPYAASLASFLWDICKQNSPRSDAAKRGVPSGVILFADIKHKYDYNKQTKNYNISP